MKLPIIIDPRYHDAVLFDLGGVLTDTASIHQAAWTVLFDDYLVARPERPGEDHAWFTDTDYRHHVDGKPRYDGVADFLKSRGISLPWGTETDDTDDTVCGLGNRKQKLFLDLAASGVRVFQSTVEPVRQLQQLGIGTAVFSASRNCEDILRAAGIADLFPVRVDGMVAEELGLPGKPDPAVLLETARRVGVRPDRCVVAEDSEAGVTAGRDSGFALVIGVDRTDHGEELLESGADAVVLDLVAVRVATGYDKMSALPDVLDSYGEITTMIAMRQPVLLFDFDGTLSEVVNDPGAATLIPGMADALKSLAAHCPVAVVSGRALTDIQARVGLPGIWYAGSHGFEPTVPDGTHHQNDEAMTAVDVLEHAAAELSNRLSGIDGLLVENKRFSVAVHYRNVASERVAEVTSTPTAIHRPYTRTGTRPNQGEPTDPIFTGGPQHR